MEPALGSLTAFFILAIAISWLIGLPLYGSSLGLPPLPALPHHHYYVALGPMLAAFIVTAATRGLPGVKELVGRIFKWRVRTDWYAYSLFGPVVIFLAAAIVQGMASGIWPDDSAFGRSAEFPGLGLLGFWVLQTLTFGLGEEVGWRGYAQPRLQGKRSALAASMILTVFWAIWHIPMFFYRAGFASMNAADIGGWLLSLAVGSVLLAWFYNSTRGSILMPILFHGSVDVAFTSEAAGGSVTLIMAALLIVWALLVVALGGPKNLSRYGKHVIEDKRAENGGAT